MDKEQELVTNFNKLVEAGNNLEAVMGQGGAAKFQFAESKAKYGESFNKMVQGLNSTEQLLQNNRKSYINADGEGGNILRVAQ
jgi:hypothetical protein